MTASNATLNASLELFRALAGAESTKRDAAADAASFTAGARDGLLALAAECDAATQKEQLQAACALLLKARGEELSAAGLKTKSADGKKDAVLNRISSLTSRVLKDLETFGTCEPTDAARKDLREQEKARKAGEEQDAKSAREATIEGRATFRPLQFSDCTSMLFGMVRAGTLTRAEWAVLRDLSETVARLSPLNVDMGAVVEVQPQALTH